jgi:hypothetical protein
MKNFISKHKSSELTSEPKVDLEAHRAVPANYDTNGTTRSASPTPSEQEELNRPFLPKGWYKERQYQSALLISSWLKRLNFKLKIVTLATMIVLTVAVIVFAVYHRKIEEGLLPVAHWMKSQKAGWLIPIALLFVVSFPPLFGHEIIGVLTGDVYGLGVGFAIIAAGTLLGEIANYL